MQTVHAVTDIAPGVELGVTYVEPFAKRSVRRKRLEEKFGFLCSCAICSSDSSNVKVGLTRPILLQMCVLPILLDAVHSALSIMNGWVRVIMASCVGV